MRDSAKLCSDLTLLMPCGQRTLFDDLCTLLSLSVEGVVALLLFFEKYQSEHCAFCCTSSRPDFTLTLKVVIERRILIYHSNALRQSASMDVSALSSSAYSSSLQSVSLTTITPWCSTSHLCGFRRIQLLPAGSCPSTAKSQAEKDRLASLEQVNDSTASAKSTVHRLGITLCHHWNGGLLRFISRLVHVQIDQCRRSVSLLQHANHYTLRMLFRSLRRATWKHLSTRSETPPHSSSLDHIQMNDLHLFRLSLLVVVSSLRRIQQMIRGLQRRIHPLR
jgi:hypothetical protein